MMHLQLGSWVEDHEGYEATLCSRWARESRTTASYADATCKRCRKIYRSLATYSECLVRVCRWNGRWKDPNVRSLYRRHRYRSNHGLDRWCAQLGLVETLAKRAWRLATADGLTTGVWAYPAEIKHWLLDLVMERREQPLSSEETRR